MIAAKGTKQHSPASYFLYLIPSNSSTKLLDHKVRGKVGTRGQPAARN